MAPISDRDWNEIVEVNPGLEWVEDLVRNARGNETAQRFRDHAIDRLRAGDQRFAAASALDTVMRESLTMGEGD